MNMYMITLFLFLLCVIICVVKIKLANICIGKGIVHNQIIITVVGLISTLLFGLSSLDAIQSSYSVIVVRFYNLKPPIDAKDWINEIKKIINK